MQEGTFDSDAKLNKELIRIPKNDGSKLDRIIRIGIVLVSSIHNCLRCNSKLHIRPDRFTAAVLYGNEVGTLPALHFTRYCRRSGCSFQQHYGHYTCGKSDDVIYDDDALEYPYFMSSRETDFTIKMLMHFDSECLIGQISYKQSAEIYNHHHKYEGVDQTDPRYNR